VSSSGISNQRVTPGQEHRVSQPNEQLELNSYREELSRRIDSIKLNLEETQGKVSKEVFRSKLISVFGAAVNLGLAGAAAFLGLSFAWMVGAFGGILLICAVMAQRERALAAVFMRAASQIRNEGSECLHTINLSPTQAVLDFHQMSQSAESLQEKDQFESLGESSSAADRSGGSRDWVQVVRGFQVAAIWAQQAQAYRSKSYRYIGEIGKAIVAQLFKGPVVFVGVLSLVQRLIHLERKKPSRGDPPANLRVSVEDLLRSEQKLFDGVYAQHLKILWCLTRLPSAQTIQRELSNLQPSLDDEPSRGKQVAGEKAGLTTWQEWASQNVSSLPETGSWALEAFMKAAPNQPQGLQDSFMF
jgi:hypothetical protein